MKVNFTMIPNYVQEALTRTRISGEARQCLDLIMRKTWGFQKEEDFIALSQFVEATGIKKPEVVRALKKLTEMNIVGKNANDRGNSYFVNTEVTSWVPLAKMPTLAKKQMIVGKKANASLAKMPHTKETTTKETITKESEHTFSESLEDLISEFRKHRKAMKKPMTDKAEEIFRKKILTALPYLGEDGMKREIENRIEVGHQTILYDWVKPPGDPPKPKLTPEQFEVEFERQRQEHLAKYSNIRPILHET